MTKLHHLYITTNTVRLFEQTVITAGKKAEICGLVGGFFDGPEGAVVTAVHPLLNLSLRKHSFAVDVEEFRRERDAIEYSGLVPLALYHSHLDGLTRPSFRDTKLPRITGLPLLILARDDGKLRFECYGDVQGRMVPISVVTYYDLEDSHKLGQQ